MLLWPRPVIGCAPLALACDWLYVRRRAAVWSSVAVWQVALVVRVGHQISVLFHERDLILIQPPEHTADTTRQTELVSERQDGSSHLST